MKCLLFVLFFTSLVANAQITQIQDTILMGSNFRITVVNLSKLQSNNNINEAISEIIRIENLISDWKPNSQISQVNTNAGIKPVKVDIEVFELTKRAIFYSEITNGAFDISFAAMEKIWKFDGTMDQLPTQKQIENAIKNVGYQNIVLNQADTTIFLKNLGMKIGFGSIGKGYAANKGKQKLEELGVKNAIVDASGDLFAFGNQTNGKPWRIGITNPIKPNKYADILSLNNLAVTTSGDYQKFIYIGNTRYAHIINPKTGWPSTGLTSVTIVGPDAEMANAFSTAIMVLGSKNGQKILKNYPNYGGLFITDKGKILKTKNYKKVLKNNLNK